MGEIVRKLLGENWKELLGEIWGKNGFKIDEIINGDGWKIVKKLDKKFLNNSKLEFWIPKYKFRRKPLDKLHRNPKQIYATI